MTRTVTGLTPATDVIALNGADVAVALDRFVRSCHQDLVASRNYTLVSPLSPVAHFDVRCATTGAAVAATDLVPGASIGGVTLVAGDKVLVTAVATGIAGIWTCATTTAARPTPADTYQELVATPYVYVAEGTSAGRWYLLTDLLISDIVDADYGLIAQ